MRGVAALAAAVAAIAAGSASAGTAETTISTNWSGYAATAPDTSFTSVTATWRQPYVTCASAKTSTASSFWVGLGGYTESSTIPEQAGTRAECDDSGNPVYYAWYELAPSHAVKVNLLVRPGDVITASVNVEAQSVLVQIKNRSRNRAWTHELPLTLVDLSSAEWVAETPSECYGVFCQTTPLANFGSVAFSKIAALGNGIGGTLKNPSWKVTPIKLVPGGSGLLQAGAVPSALSADGSSFDVRWQPNPA